MSAKSSLSLRSGLVSDLSLEPQRTPCQSLSQFEAHTILQETPDFTSTPMKPTGQSLDSPAQFAVTSSSQSRSNGRRKFVKRDRFKRRCKAKAGKQLHLWTYYSSHTLTSAQSRFIELGLNFVVLPRSLTEQKWSHH